MPRDSYIFLHTACYSLYMLWASLYGCTPSLLRFRRQHLSRWFMFGWIILFLHSTCKQSSNIMVMLKFLFLLLSIVMWFPCDQFLVSCLNLSCVSNLCKFFMHFVNKSSILFNNLLFYQCDSIGIFLIHMWAMNWSTSSLLAWHFPLYSPPILVGNDKGKASECTLGRMWV